MSVRKKRTGYEVRQSWRKERIAVYLPRSTKRQAEQVDSKLRRIIAAKTSGVEVDPEDARWIAELDDRLHDKLVAKGILEPRAEVSQAPTAEEYSEDFIRGHAGKASTIEQIEISRHNLLESLPDGIRLDEVTGGHAEDMRSMLQGRGLAEATIRKRCSRAKQFFTSAMRRGLIRSNPFDAVPTSAVGNQDRMTHIEASIISDVIEKASCPHLGLVLALCRFGALRRHEALTLTWDDINMDERYIDIRSNKKPALRRCPLFGSLRPYLERVPERERHGPVQTRWTLGQNPCTKIVQAIEKAGHEPWKKTLQNLRASCITDLMGGYPIKSVTDWCGNSPEVAMKHYAIAKSQDFKRATEVA